MAKRRVFRQHPIKVWWPGLPWLILVAATLAGTLYLAVRHGAGALWLLCLLLFPGWKLVAILVQWLAFKVVFEQGSHVLLIRSALVGQESRLIPLAQMNPKSFDRPAWARLLGLDLADITIMAIGGPYPLPSIGGAQDLWTIIESHGEVVPPARRSALALLLLGLWHGVAALAGAVKRGAALAINRTLHALRAPAKAGTRARVLLFEEQMELAPLPWAGSREAADQPVQDGKYVYQGAPFSTKTPSQAGLRAFVAQFVLHDRDWTPFRYGVANVGRRYYTRGMSEKVAQLYLQWLRHNHVLIPGPSGSNGRGERLSARIRSMADVERIITESPPLWTAPRSSGRKEA